jgi:hypothetical protein
VKFKDTHPMEGVSYVIWYDGNRKVYKNKQQAIQAVYEKMSELGLLYSLVFSMKPGADKKSIHIDIDRKTQTPYWPSLNIVIDGQGVMRWFNPTKPGQMLKNNNTGVFYKAWFHDYGDIVDEWSVGKIALVRTDIPHQVWNFDNGIRRIVSIRWNKKISWEETIEWFNSNFPNK